MFGYYFLEDGLVAGALVDLASLALRLSKAARVNASPLMSATLRTIA
jgi:hypothetical protein